ncbi:MAG: hypothetical protein V3U72_01685 [Candidatus Aenigmarchaeota archaeon]
MQHKRTIYFHGPERLYEFKIVTSHPSGTSYEDGKYIFRKDFGIIGSELCDIGFTHVGVRKERTEDVGSDHKATSIFKEVILNGEYLPSNDSSHFNILVTHPPLRDLIGYIKSLRRIKKIREIKRELEYSTPSNV